MPATIWQGRARRRPRRASRALPIGLLLCAPLGCGSSVDDGLGGGPSDRFFATLKVTLLPGMIRSCATQFSADQDGSPFGRPAEALGMEAAPGPAEASVIVYRTDEPPQNCPPTAAPLWSGAPGDRADWTDAPVSFGPGSAFTLQVDCDACEGESEHRVTLELQER